MYCYSNIITDKLPGRDVAEAIFTYNQLLSSYSSWRGTRVELAIMVTFGQKGKIGVCKEIVTS